MAHARSPEFFTDFGIPDTVMGRFDMLSLHIYLLARRFREDGSGLAQDLSQEVFDLYIYDVERALRELGIGDTSVPKKKKRMIRSFYGQIDDFDEPLNNGDDSLIAQKVEARYLSETPNADPGLITKYMLATENHLQQTDIKKLMSNQLEWLDPASI